MKIRFLLIAIHLSIFVYTQVGLNVDNPKATLDVEAKEFDGVSTFPEGVALPKINRLRAANMQNINESTLIYVNDISVGTATGIAENITELGYYFFKDNKWIKLDFPVPIPTENHTNAIIKEKINNRDIIKLGGNLTEPTVINTSNTNTLAISGLINGNVYTDRILTIDPEDRIKNDFNFANELFNPTVFSLPEDQTNFLRGNNAGSSQNLPMVMIRNSVKYLTYNESTSVVSIPSGTYQVTYNYEAIHNSSGCTIGSYYVDFPTTGARKRVHTTSNFNQGENSRHGGTVSMVIVLDQTLNYTIRLGRGQSGNCAGDSGMTLIGDSTQFILFRIGD